MKTGETLRLKRTKVADEDRERNYGVQYDDGFVVECTDEDDARSLRQVTGGDVVMSERTPWMVIA